ncbi:hypothetical protein XU18_5118 [Perkinsela sp. CCAP 1560/4]|nr:hypothetical protein XU18_5118 [Perkinsela sp. CCAP 1560/4]|eukprot:KNH01750.1 hypothetical protein XU18_5118 [Perkinsela sp. CCAP 1560/4]
MFYSRRTVRQAKAPNAVSANIGLLAPKYRQTLSGHLKGTLRQPPPKSPESVLKAKASMFSENPQPDSSIVPSRAQPEDASEINPRRWVRDPFETCVLKTQRVSDILPHYLAYYKFADYTWRPILCVPAGDPVGLETRARHIAYELRHLSEFGHAIWSTTKTQHSVFHPRGIIERSYVECTYVKGNRQKLQCYIRHEGLRDGDDPESKRGLIAVSMVFTLSGPEDRWSMLVCRSRRNGAMSGGLGALTLRLVKPELVGKKQQEEVFLLDPHTNVIGNGLSARCIASCWNICKHPHLYVHPMEVPVSIGLDSVMQGIHYTALTENRLIAPGEQMICLAFSVESYHPYPPIEAELPYTISLSSPVVFSPEDMKWEDSGSIGTPLLDGGPIQRYSAAITVGFAQFSDQRTMHPIENAQRWWAHKDETPYRITMYTTRSAHLPKLFSADSIHENPFEKGRVFSCPNTKTIERERLRNAMWRRVEEYGSDPEADIDGDGDVKLLREERQDTKPFLLSTMQDKSPEEIQNHESLTPSDGKHLEQTTLESVRKRLGITEDSKGGKPKT